MEWFESWFDSKYYHILYSNRNDKEAEIFLRNLENKNVFNTESKIIDIGCGRGRHARFLNKLGYNVLGIDLSKKSIDFAKKYENKNLTFDVSDMRECYKKNTFDVALNLFTSFGYFNSEKDDIKTLLSIKESLKINGILILDFLNTNRAISHLIQRENKTTNNISFEIERFWDDQYIYKTISLNDNGTKHKYRERVRRLTLSKFHKLISVAGLTIINTFGNYNLDSFDQNSSERLILICKKWN